MRGPFTKALERQGLVFTTEWRSGFKIDGKHQGEQVIHRMYVDKELLRE